MDIFFNENNIEDHSTFSIFEEVKRKGMTPNLPLQVIDFVNKNFHWKIETTFDVFVEFFKRRIFDSYLPRIIRSYESCSCLLFTKCCQT